MGGGLVIKINGIPVNVTMFPDRTSQVWKLPKKLETELSLDIEWEFEHEGELKTVFLNGKMIKETTLAEVRANVAK